MWGSKLSNFFKSLWKAKPTHLKQHLSQLLVVRHINLNGQLLNLCASQFARRSETANDEIRRNVFLDELLRLLKKLSSQNNNGSCAISNLLVLRFGNFNKSLKNNNNNNNKNYFKREELRHKKKTDRCIKKKLF